MWTEMERRAPARVGSDEEGRTVKKRWAIVVGATVIARAAAWAGAAPAPQKLDIQHHKFLPPTVTVPVGSTLTWVNRDEDTHTVTSTTGSFASEAIDHDQVFTHTFAKPGTYTYFCALHPLMRAVVVVQ